MYIAAGIRLDCQEFVDVCDPLNIVVIR